MKNTRKAFVALSLVLCLLVSMLAYTPAAAPVEALDSSYTLVWSDEFDGNSLNTSNWTCEIGTGDSGWGNNEWEYYTDRPENVSVANGVLTITARKENYGGCNYTSARLKTQGKKSFTYGYIEARIKLPTGQGLWPAFWMLGESISSVGWPKCGEIDIMERVNSEQMTHGTIHWDINDSYSSYGGASFGFDPGQYHTYAIEWTEQSIIWYVDGTQFWIADISNRVNSTDEFHQPQFILLNLAVGGNWPGYPNNSTPFPAQMQVDYVRVYQKNGSGSTGGSSTSPASLADGTYYFTGVNTGKVVCADNSGADILAANRDAHGGEWEQLTVVNNSDGTISLRSGANGNYVCVVDDENDQLLARSASIGTWEKFYLEKVTDSQYALKSYITGKYVTVNENDANRLYATASSVQAWEVFTITRVGGSTTPTTPTNAPTTTTTKAPAVSGGAVTVQAESYAYMSGIETETCAEGGSNVGYIDSGDWMSYDVNIPTAGTYKVEFRVASANGGGVLRLEQNSGATNLGEVSVPNTGDWQNWQTVSMNVKLSAGAQSFGVAAPAGGWNLNWIKFTPVTSSGATVTVQAEDYSYMSGIETETCAEGGSNVGYIDSGDWLSYDNVQIPASGTYRVEFRVASPNNGGAIRFEENSSAINHGTVTVANTGDWQNWQTVSMEVYLSAGAHSFGVAVPTGGYNLNYIRFVQL